VKYLSLTRKSAGTGQNGRIPRLPSILEDVTIVKQSLESAGKLKTDSILRSGQEKARRETDGLVIYPHCMD
jgi:hypothetical protein